MLNLVRDLTWPDFEVYVDGSLITLKRVKEKHFPQADNPRMGKIR